MWDRGDAMTNTNPDLVVDRVVAVWTGEVPPAASLLRLAFVRS